jgi:hypothetical protein
MRTACLEFKIPKLSSKWILRNGKWSEELIEDGTRYISTSAYRPYPLTVLTKSSARIHSYVFIVYSCSALSILAHIPSVDILAAQNIPICLPSPYPLSLVILYLVVSYNKIQTCVLSPQIPLGQQFQSFQTH